MGHVRLVTPVMKLIRLNMLMYFPALLYICVQNLADHQIHSQGCADLPMFNPVCKIVQRTLSVMDVNLTQRNYYETSYD